MTSTNTKTITYLLLLLAIFSSNTIHSQVTVKYTLQPTTPFDDVAYGEIDFADIDNDGDEDVLISGETSSGNRIAKLYENNGSGSFTLKTGTPFIGVYLSSHEFADVDGDNDLDVIISGLDGNGIRRTDLFTNDGSGNFTLSTSNSFVGVRTSNVSFADINGDGDQDVLISGRDASFNYVTNIYSNNGLGGFTLNSNITVDSVISAEVIFSDFDRDNDQDLLIYGTSSQGNIAKLYRNTGSGFFFVQNNTPFIPVNVNSGITQNYLASADIDGDGDEDILSVGDSAFGSAFTALYRNNGFGNFSLLPSGLDHLRSNAICGFSDVDTDGDMDIITSGHTAGSLFALTRVYLNNGTGSFSPINVGAFSNWRDRNSGREGDMAFSDVDGDGDEDMLIQGYDALTFISTRLLLNTSCIQTNAVLNAIDCGSYTAPSGKLFVTSGTYSDTIQNTTGCDSVLTINLTIRQTISDTLAVSSCGIYTWSKNGMSYTNSGRYSDTLMTSTGCDSVSILDLTINSIPSANAAPDQSICEGSGIQIGGSPTGPAGSTFSWSDASTLSNASSANPIAFPLVTTRYYVTVTDANACTNVDSMFVSVNTKPSVDAGLDRTICEGSGIQIGGSPTGPVGSTFFWSDIGTLNSGSSANPIASPHTTTRYYVTVTNGNGCTNVDSMFVTVNPTPAVDAGPDLTICSGESVQIGGSPTSATVGAAFLWNNGQTLNNTMNANPISTPSTTTTYSVLVTDIIGCTAADTTTVFVNNVPQPSSVSIATCDRYVWPLNGQTYTASGAYTDTTVNTSGCDSVVTLILTVDTVSTIILQTGFQLTAEQSGAQYQWFTCSPAITPIPGATNQSYTVTANGSYGVEIMTNNCLKWTNCVSVIGVGLDSNEPEVFARIYPNPAKEYVTIELNQFQNADEELFIYDLRGKLLYRQTIKARQTRINSSDLATGIYMVRIGSWNEKLIIR